MNPTFSALDDYIVPARPAARHSRQATVRWGERVVTIGGDAPVRVLAENRSFKVAIAHGMTDLVTPYMTSRYVIDHLPTTLTKDRVSLSLHPGGHMMYLRREDLAKLKSNVASFITESVSKM